jgi:16S rRNA (guanine(966)-N(2))-methyltransferase RsmD
MIQDEIRGVGFADLFCGAGGVGIEALSRGASVVHFVDDQSAAVGLLRKNLDDLDVPAVRFRVHPEDVFRFLEAGGLAGAGIAVVFADPPYQGGFDRRLLAHFRSKVYDQLETFVLEHRAPVDCAALGTLAFEKTKTFGDTNLSFWSRTPRRSF